MLNKRHYPVLVANLIIVIGFGFLFASRENYEFLIYVGSIVFFLSLILFTLKRTKFSDIALWGLTLWALLHMSGGGILIGDGRLYELMLIPLSDSYPIFRYDQFVHIVGFGVATLVMYELIKPMLKPNWSRWTALSIVIIMAGLGAGSLNEILEFMATVVTPKTGVGGYVNTSLDSVSNLIGAILAMMMIRCKEMKQHS